MPVVEKIDDPTILKMPDSIRPEAIHTDSEIYIGVYNAASFRIISPIDEGTRVHIKNETVYYYFESVDTTINRTEYNFFAIDLSENLPIKRSLMNPGILNFNNQLVDKHTLSTHTISYEEHNGNVSWEAVSMDPPLYLNVEIHPGRDSTDIGFMCLEFSNEDALISALTEKAIYVEGFHFITGLDKDGYNKEGYDADGLDRSGKTREENIRLAEEARQTQIPVKNVSEQTPDLNIPDGPQPILTVMDFISEGVSSQESIFISDFLSSCLFDTKAYRIIDRSKRETILEEIKFSNSGCSDESCQIEIGKLLAADKIVVGSIGKVGSRYMLNVKLLEVVSGETISTGYDVFPSIDELIDGCSLIARQLTQGYIDSVD